MAVRRYKDTIHFPATASWANHCGLQDAWIQGEIRYNPKKSLIFVKIFPPITYDGLSIKDCRDIVTMADSLIDASLSVDEQEGWGDYGCMGHTIYMTGWRQLTEGQEEAVKELIATERRLARQANADKKKLAEEQEAAKQRAMIKELKAAGFEVIAKEN